MKVDRLNQWLTLAANLGVLAGILLVVFELGQNRDELAQNRQMIRAQTRNEVAVQLVNLMSQVASDPELASILNRAWSGEELSAREVVQFNHRTIAMLRYFENVHYQYRQGLYDESEFATQQEAWRDFLANRSTVVFWCGYRHTLSAEFRVAFESLMTEQPF